MVRVKRSTSPESSTIADLFEAQARCRRDKTAILTDTTTITYEELNRRANLLTSRLGEAGVGPDVVVGVALNRGPEFVVAILAILKAGGAYLPLDPAYPPERLAFMVHDSRVPAVIVEQHSMGIFPRDCREISLGTNWLDRSEAAVVNPAPRSHPGGLAYVMYTSGSSGRPKGVMVEQRSVARLVLNPNYAELTSSDVILQLAPTSFDASTFEIWGALLNGGVLAIPSFKALSAMELRQAIQRFAGTTLWLTAPLFHVIAEEDVTAFHGLRQLLTGGDVLNPDAVHRFAKSLPNIRLINGYGPTECTTFACCHTIETPSLSETVPIGLPINETTVRLLNTRLEEVSPYDVGEIYLGGLGLARGYVGGPGLTAERFIPDPWSSRPGARIYRTGDLGRFRQDGVLEFLGRSDRQVKIRGHRVECGEIESTLTRHPRVSQATVLIREGTNDIRKIVAYVVGTGSKQEHKRERIAEWAALFDATYAGPGDSLQNDEYLGWNSSYTRTPLSREEMDEWTDTTVARIAACTPKSILELGCGTGILMRRLAPICDRYAGIDISVSALEKAGRENSRAELYHRDAGDLNDFNRGNFDTVILNSVIQYFPSLPYLEEVLSKAVDLVEEGGHIFVGDVRNLAVLRAHHASLEASRAESLTLSKVLLQQRIDRSMENEQELVILPAYFAELGTRLPRIGDVQISPRRGRAPNELTKFRYDVVIEVGTYQAPPPAPLGPRIGSILDMRRALESAGSSVCFRDIPNARITFELAMLNWLDEPEGRVSGIAETRAEIERFSRINPGVNPEDVWPLGEQFGYSVLLSWAASNSEGEFDALFTRHHRPRMPLAPGVVSSAFSNNPLLQLEHATLASELREWLESVLPDYMRPADIVVLQEMPLTANGKIDHSRLPEPMRLMSISGYRSPRTPAERTVAEAWSDVLGMERIGIDEDFFLLGGDSLAAIRVINRLQRHLGQIIHANAVFDAPTIRLLAEYLESNYGSETKNATQASSMVDSLSLSALRRRFDEFYSASDRKPFRRKNQKALFLLCAPRSGSTLLRVMLAAHPALFVPPELELLGFDDMDQRNRALAGRNTYLGVGLITALTTLRDTSVNEAELILNEFVERKTPCQRVYQVIQEACEERILADKSANYSTSMRVLNRSESWFERPTYVFLTRNPETSVRSFVSTRMDLLTDWGLKYSAATLGELYWRICNENIVQFLFKIPGERCCWIRYEDLVEEPETIVRGLCNFLELDFDPSLLAPYDGSPSRMTEGPYPESRGVGDVKFKSHTTIDTENAQLKGGRRFILHEATRHLASKFGYTESDTRIVPNAMGSARFIST